MKRKKKTQKADKRKELQEIKERKDATMIFWLCLILTTIFALLANLLEEECVHDGLFMLSIVTSSVSRVTCLIMLFIIIAVNAGGAGRYIALKKEYEALVCKARTEEARDEFGLLSKDYVDEIQEWNVSIASLKKLQRDFWIGIFYPNIYDDIDTIDLSEITYRER